MQNAKCKYQNAKYALESTKLVIFKTTILITYFEKVKVKYSRCNYRQFLFKDVVLICILQFGFTF
jgi:hypothetical protein